MPLIMSNITRKPPVHRIILEQMSQCCRIGKIINRPHHHIGPQQQLPEDHPSYPSKTVYPYIQDGQIYTIKSEKLHFFFSKRTDSSCLGTRWVSQDNIWGGRY